MCRGCTFALKQGGGKSYEPGVCEAYLDWLNNYQLIIAKMKKLEKELLVFQETINDKSHKKLLDKHRKQLIRSRKAYAKADMLLSDV